MKDALSNSVSAEKLAADFRADPNRKFSDAEADLLSAASGRDLWAAKAAALHNFRKGDFERALGLMTSLVEREATPENVKNVAVTLRSLGRAQEAVDWMESRKDGFDAIEYHDVLCSLLVRLGRINEAVAHGDRALALKDEAAPSCNLPAPVVRRFDVGRRSRNLIVFSVWGDDVRYLNGAITNAIVARYLYPGWTARFYADASTPPPFRDALVQNGAQVVMVEDLPADRFGLFWRFLAEDDPDIDIYVVRDADSVMNIKERWAVADWLKSGKAFHVMRDNPQHSELILAGMWGAHRGNIGGMRKRIEDSVRAGRNIGNNSTLDQHFLRNVVWPIARNSVKIHDDYFDFMAPTRFDPSFRLPGSMHVGQNDWVNFRRSGISEAR
jgi:tetratricopeptide (TPR) repeat protein